MSEKDWVVVVRKNQGSASIGIPRALWRQIVDEDPKVSLLARMIWNERLGTLTIDFTPRFFLAGRA